MLLIDIGNSRIKAGFLNAVGIQLLPPCAWREQQLDTAWSGLLPGLARVDRVVVSNVGGATIADSLIQWLAEHWQVTPHFARVLPDFGGMRTRYEYPEKLGIDRWLAALAGFRMSKRAVCVVDAGTALTADVVNARGEHLGGLIAPGLALMARSLTQGTAQLVIDTVQPVDRIATNTASAISLGCREAVAGLLSEFSRRLSRELPGPTDWWLTGGEAPTLLELSDLPLRHVPDLVLQGLACYGEHL
jgi:type III pantothenate kinase